MFCDTDLSVGDTDDEFILNTPIWYVP